MNFALFRFINHTIKNPFLDRWIPLFSDKDYVVLPGAVALGLVVYFGGRRARTCVLAIVLALMCSDIGTEKVLKNIFRAQRPHAVLENVHHHRSGEWADYEQPRRHRDSYAFPSTHAANTAALAAVLALFYRKSLWASVPLTLLVGFSRSYTGNHFPGDVLWGYITGGAVGFFAAKASPWLMRRVFGEEKEDVVRPPMPPERKVFLVLLGAWTLINFGFVHLNLFTLAGDEAQYWDWSRRLALGYYSKPPLIAYLMKVLRSAGGNQEWALRTGAVLCASGTLALIYALTFRIARSEKTALLAAIVTIAMPLSWAGSVLMTIDPVMSLFWILAMYAFHRAIHGERGMWVLTGFALGLGLLAKYTVLLLVLSLALYLVLYGRQWLRTRGPYLALAIAGLCMSGVLYWNAAHDWVSFRHTVSIGGGEANSLGRALGHFLEYLGAQAGVTSPILFVLFLWAIIVLARRFRADPGAAFLVCCFSVLFGFYALVAFTRPPQANWPAAAYLAAAPALACVWHQRERSKTARRVLAAGIALGCVLGIAARSTDLLYLLGEPAGEQGRLLRVAGMTIDPDKDPTNELSGGRELGEALSKHVHGSKYGPFPFSDRYQLTALCAFYTSGRPRAYCMNPGSRRYNQYDLWGGWNKLEGRDGIFVTGGSELRARAFVDGMVQKGAFERGEVLETVEVRRGGVLIKTYTLSRMYGYTGKPWATEEGHY